MALAQFILQNIESILREWENSARTVAVHPPLAPEALRYQAEQMLRFVARDMESPQTAADQLAKSRGNLHRLQLDHSAAESHAEQRFTLGFHVNDVVMEFRALRASVLRLYEQQEFMSSLSLAEVTRFNESLDQLLAESVAKFSSELDHARELFMGVLGHDLRTHIQILLTCAMRLSKTAPEGERTYAQALDESTRSILRMTEDLLDVSRTRLGREMPFHFERIDAVQLCHQVVESFRAAHPSISFDVSASGCAIGEWDGHRLEQMLVNLVRNAIQHGDVSRAITLSLEDEPKLVRLRVHNHGRPIPDASLQTIFEPLQRGDRAHGEDSLGLGLYIARTIARTHGGAIIVESTEVDGTSFIVMLPKRAT